MAPTRLNGCWTWTALCGSLLLVGCTDLFEQASGDGEKESILGKKTQDIGKFDPKAGKAVSDSKVRATNPVTAPLEAYGPMVEQISKAEIEHAVKLFQAMNGRYPKDHDEFMREVIKKNRIQLPVLPGDKRYEYDVQNHELVVVDASPEAPAPQ